MKVVLASSSPRRKEILQQIGCSFTVVASQVEEDNRLEVAPCQLVILHAKSKALAARDKVDSDTVIIGADTVVVFAGQVFGKPSGVQEAKQMLMALSGRQHEVITGVAVVKCSTGEMWTDYSVTQVKFSVLSESEIDCYIASGEPMDKAGAYGIQGRGSLLVESINGCYFNVVGLPVSKLYGILKKAGVFLV
ncbi:hypothetical protein P22_3572 [Propionispora sp. 2/2-37]|uniref:Maf family protein n=1 Tax=Propionispora sp. 2/2-37 TaxID=1677858 RepID=UPI0006BB8635|nr:Maf family protein [Propionispora sp. 2/2-37]CUH97442.1 hypothetical protein P22_3572 [Propionispora sp. 2/2-37]